MPPLDDLPRRDENRRVQEKSESAFQGAISECSEFVVQSSDKNDYGTDYLIEATDAAMMTNVRVQVQLKGTNRKKNSDGSVSLSVKRTTLNYLAMQPGALFVCFHLPERQLLVRRVDDVLREYGHRNRDWVNQTVTIKFTDKFDSRFQFDLKRYVLTHSKSARDQRLNVLVNPPENILSCFEDQAIDVPVPAQHQQASNLLSRLYDGGEDRSISHSFDKFLVILDSSSPEFLPAYMAEINLGLNGKKYDSNRIKSAIDKIESFLDAGHFSKDSLLYCLGNAWLVLGEYEKAKEAYSSALTLLDQSGVANLTAQCCKNFGAVMEKLNCPEEAHALYTRAVELDPDLPEAHFALAIWYYRHSHDLARTLKHLDSIVWTSSSAGRLASVLGWRLRVFFEQGRIEEAFRDIRDLLSEAKHLEWVWPWCARMVATYGTSSVQSAPLSLKFWNRYLQKFPDHLIAKIARLHCVWTVHEHGEEQDLGESRCSFEEFKNGIEDIMENGQQDRAFLWDRAGHWAQTDENWVDAEKCYRKAFEVSPEIYGYCLGTALNFLGRYAEALPILLDQAERYQPDAMSWFQVAVAMEGTGDLQGSIGAYRIALERDEDYDLAWFNLGGVYWNLGKEVEALSIWKQAVRRFPMHDLAIRLKQDFPIEQE